MRSALVAVLATAVFAHPLAGQGSARQSGDPLAEADRLLERHEYQAAREVVTRFWSAAGDSVRGDRRARALMLRSVLAASVEEAEVDLLRISVEHPQSPEADRALMRLAQARLARGDSSGARLYLERLVRDHPTSSFQRPARETLGLPAAPAVTPAAGPTRVSTADRQPAPTRPSTTPQPAAAGRSGAAAGELTIEIGRFANVQEAEELRDAVRAAGFTAFLARPGRSGTTVVRFGSFRDRPAAEAEARRIRQAGFTAVITGVATP